MDTDRPFLLFFEMNCPQWIRSYSIVFRGRGRHTPLLQKRLPYLEILAIRAQYLAGFGTGMFALPNG